MIIVDPRVGSGDLTPLLSSLGCPAETQHLDFGDAMFLGSGQDGAPVPVGIEVKRLDDVLQCITSGRFVGHQLPGLLRTYEHTWLVVEGVYRANPVDGTLETRNGKGWNACGHGKQTWMYRSLDKWLTKLEVKAGVHVRRTGNRDETARTIAALYHWWQEYDDHQLDDLDRSNQIALAQKVAGEGTGIWLGERTGPTLLRRVAAELPGIGIEKSGMVAGHFSNVTEMVMADEAEWRKLPLIGKKTAARIVKELQS